MSAVLQSAVFGQVRRLIAVRGADGQSDSDLLQSFCETGDEAAFAALVRRHGSLVFNVCKRVLHHQQDAEDAFQATFLILARNVAAVRNRHALAAWLHRSAYRMALGIRRAADRRRHHEGQATAMTSREPSVDLAWRELQTLLEDEIQRLPEKYRMAFVLCCMEGSSRAEVARLLGIKEGTISSRIDQARKRLQCRLARRGVTLSAVMAAINLAGQTKAFADLGRLFTATARAAVLISAGNGTSVAVVGERISGLVDRGTRALLCAKSTVASLLLTACLAMIGVGLIACQSPADRRELRELALQPDAVSDPESQPDEKPQHVDVHGDPLPKGALARLGTLRFRPGGFVSSLVFAPDAKTLVSLGTDGNVCVFDTQDGRAVRRFRAGGIPGQSAVSADGRLIATLEGKDSPFNPEVSVDLWDTSTAQKIITFGKGPFVSATFSADGKTLAVLRYDNVVELWDTQTGRVLCNWKTDDEPGYDLAIKGRFTPDGKTLVTKHRLQGYRSWDVASGRPLHEIKDLYMSHLFAVSSRGILAVDRRDPAAAEPKKDTPAEVQLRLIDLAAGKDFSHLAAPTAPGPYGRLTGISCGEFSPDGKLLVTAGYDRQIRLWDVATSKLIRSWPFIAATPMALRFSADGKRIALAEGGMSIRLFDVTDGTETATPLGNRTGFFQSRFCLDGESVITLNSLEHTLHSWDLTTGRLRRRQELPAEETARSTLSRDGDTVFSWSLDGDLRACDSVTGKDVRRLGNHEMPYGHFIVPSADGKMLALVGQSPAIVLADAITGKETRRITAHTPWPIGAAFSADCKSLTSWGVDGKARIWDLATGHEIREIPFTEGPEPAPDPVPAGPGPVAAPGRNSLIIFSAAVSPDGRTLAFGSRRGFIAIHDTATGQEVRRLEKLPTGVSEMAFSPDGRMLAWSDMDESKVHLLEVATGKERHVFAGHLGSVKSLTFSPDGRKLISSGEDTTALVWDLGPTAKALNLADQESAWKTLADSDISLAYRNVRLLASAPGFVAGKLQPVAPIDSAKMNQLIANLDSDKFAVRTKASEELNRLGDVAGPACRKALAARPPVDAQRRLEAVLEAIARSARELSPERLRNARSLEALELSGTKEALQVFQKLAGGAEGAWLTEEAKAALGRMETEAKRR